MPPSGSTTVDTLVNLQLPDSLKAKLLPEATDASTRLKSSVESKKADTSVANSVNLPLALFGGAGIGLLFGVIMGTSVTPTVATMLVTLTTLLAGILGLNDRHFNDAKAARIGAFGLFCVLGAYLGLYVRSHNLMAPEPLDLKQLYLKAGFSEAQALNFIAIKEFGLSLNQINQQSGEIPQSVTVVAAQADTQSAISNLTDAASEAATLTTTIAATPDMSNSVAFKQHSVLLFSAPVEVSGCEELIFTDDSLPLDEIINNYELTSFEWQELVIGVLENVPEVQQKNVLLATKDSVCAFPDDEIEQCDQVADLFNLNSAEAIPEISALNFQWRAIVENVQRFGIPESEILMSIRQIHSMLCKGGNS